MNNNVSYKIVRGKISSSLLFTNTFSADVYVIGMPCRNINVANDGVNYKWCQRKLGITETDQNLAGTVFVCFNF